MFGKKKQEAPKEVRLKVEVISVTNVKAGETTLISGGRYGNSWSNKINGGAYTTVLYTVDGVLNTRNFTGTWTLNEVKNWQWTIKEED